MFNSTTIIGSLSLDLFGKLPASLGRVPEFFDLFLFEELIVSLDLPDLVAYSLPLLLNILSLLVMHGLVEFLLFPVALLLLEEVLDLSEFSAVDDTLLDVPLLLLDLQLLKQQGHLDLLVLKVLLNGLLFTLQVLLTVFNHHRLTQV